MKKAKPNTLVIKVKNNNVQGKAKTAKPKIIEGSDVREGKE